MLIYEICGVGEGLRNPPSATTPQAGSSARHNIPLYLPSKTAGTKVDSVDRVGEVDSISAWQE